MTQPIVIFGGTFDPVHNGHLRVAWEVAEALHAPVRITPCRQPPHRAPPIATGEERVQMLRLALLGQDRLLLDQRELHRAGPSFTIDTLVELRAEVGPDQPIVLVVGTDAFAGFPYWKRWQELFDLAHMVVLTRPGSAIAFPIELQSAIELRKTFAVDALSQAPAGLVLRLNVSALDISATAVRELLAQGLSPRYLVPDALLADDTVLSPYRRSRTS